MRAEQRQEQNSSHSITHTHRHTHTQASAHGVIRCVQLQLRESDPLCVRSFFKKTFSSPLSLFSSLLVTLSPSLPLFAPWWCVVCVCERVCVCVCVCVCVRTSSNTHLYRLTTTQAQLSDISFNQLLPKPNKRGAGGLDVVTPPP